MGLMRYKSAKLLLRVLVVVFGASLVLHSFFFKSDDYWQHTLEKQALEMNKVSKFQPRAPVHEVLSFIEEIQKDPKGTYKLGSLEKGIAFHWDDWMDLTTGDALLDKYRTELPMGQCDAVLDNYCSVNPYWMELYKTKVLRQAVYAYCKAALPDRVVVTTDSHYVHVPVNSEKSQRLGYGHTSHPQEDVILGMEKIQAKSKDSKNFKTHPIVRLQREVEVPMEDFTYSPEQEMVKLQMKMGGHKSTDKKDNDNDDVDLQKLTRKEQEYFHMLRYANTHADTADKFFKYPWIYSDLFKGQAHHLSAPFFKRFISDRERESVIHHMIRAWFEFAEAHEIVTWINYGSLLGWVYNGVNMPWDTDVDIQIPIAQLSKLEQDYNRTLVLENPRYGNAKYYLEVNPFYIRQGNGKNFIDARFIEVNSGLYIDFSVLSKSIYEPPAELFEGLEEKEKNKAIALNCKNFNWQLYQEILPLKYTTFEGGASYIPHKISLILDRKYGHASYTSKLRFMNHNYQQDINMWVPDRICKASPSDTNRFVSEKDHSKLSLEGACNSVLLQDEYEIIYQSAQRHINMESKLDSPVDYDIKTTQPLPILRKDAWEYYNDINNQYVDNDRWFIKHTISSL